MSQAALDNLVRIGQLKAEPRNTTQRTLAKYEGFLEVEESDIDELCVLVSDLVADTTTLFEKAALALTPVT